MIDDWCGGDGRGRLIPLTLVPLWDPQLAADEVRRCAAKGSHAIAFSENPSKLGFPSLYSGAWDVLWDACVETDTTVSMHIGSSSTMPATSPDAPLATTMALSSQNAEGSLCDWVFSGTLSRFPTAEDRVRREPDRLDAVPARAHGHRRRRGRRPAASHLDARPSEIVKGRVWGCVFDDQHGLNSRDAVGLEHILFETDYPHTDGTWPRLARGRPPAVRDRGHGRRRVPRLPARQRDPLLRPRALRDHRVGGDLRPRPSPPTRRSSGARPARRRAARRDRAAQPAGHRRARGPRRPRRASPSPTTWCSASCAARPTSAARRRRSPRRSAARPAA